MRPRTPPSKRQALCARDAAGTGAAQPVSAGKWVPRGAAEARGAGRGGAAGRAGPGDLPGDLPGDALRPLSAHPRRFPPGSSPS